MAAKTFEEWWNSDEKWDSKIPLGQAIWNAAECANLQAHNTGSPKLLDEMELFAKECERAGNVKDAKCVRLWVKQLRGRA